MLNSVWLYIVFKGTGIQLDNYRNIYAYVYDTPYTRYAYSKGKAGLSGFGFGLGFGFKCRIWRGINLEWTMCI